MRRNSNGSGIYKNSELLYALLSYLRIYQRVREAVYRKENVWFCDHIDAPFILGIFVPKIYLPSDMEKQDRKHVVAHERAHLKRKDHWWKPIGFLMLSIHWFNPLLWVAYTLLCKDIELACDERVLLDNGTGIKKEYSESIINCSVPKKMIAACPLAFGELDVESRVKSVLDYKKPSFWMMSVAAIVFLFFSIGFLTNPVGEGWQSYHPFKDEVIADESLKENPLIENIEIIFGTNEENREIIKENILKAAHPSIQGEGFISLPSDSSDDLFWGGKEVYELHTKVGAYRKTYYFYPYGYYWATPVTSNQETTWRAYIKVAEHTLIESEDGTESEIVYGENCFHISAPSITVAVGNDTRIIECIPNGSMKTKFGEYITNYDNVWMHIRREKISHNEKYSSKDIMEILEENVETQKVQTKLSGELYDTGKISLIEMGMDEVYLIDTLKDEMSRRHYFFMDTILSRWTNSTEMTAGGFGFAYDVSSDLLESCDTKRFSCTFQYSDTEFERMENE